MIATFQSIVLFGTDRCARDFHPLRSRPSSKSIWSQLSEVTVIQREIMPLMSRMIGTPQAPERTVARKTDEETEI